MDNNRKKPSKNFFNHDDYSKSKSKKRRQFTKKKSEYENRKESRWN